MTARKAGRRWGWLPAIIAALIGAAATVAAALLASSAGAISVSVAGSGKPTVTVTPSAAATVTVTASPAAIAGPFTDANCPASEGCTARHLIVPVPSDNGTTGITLATGTVVPDGGGDLSYGRSSDGIPQVTRDEATAYSVGVTAEDASRRTCQSVTASDPDAAPISGLRQGLWFCVNTGSGIALVDESQDVTPGGVLHLTEFYWPNQPGA